MNGRNMEKRLATLEQRGGGDAAVIILNYDRLERGAALERWEAENGPTAGRHVLVVNFVKALPASAALH